MSVLLRGCPGYEVSRYEPAEIDYLVQQNNPDAGVTVNFECSRCHALRNVDEGGGIDEIDTDGTLCSLCWVELAEEQRQP